MEFQEAKAIAERLGFQLFADVRGDTNALRLFTEDFRQKYGKKYRCGVYMQFRKALQNPASISARKNF